MSNQWIQLRLDARYLGRNTGKNYYVRVPGEYMKGWYILVPTKLIRVDPSEEFFFLATKPDFEYKMFRITKDSRGNEIEGDVGRYYGRDLVILVQSEGPTLL